MWNKLQAGKIERGVIFIVVILTTLIFVGYMFVGGTLPTKIPKITKDLNLVQIVAPSPEPQKNSLQMYTFYGATITPYPTLPPNAPQPTNAVPLKKAACPATKGKANLEMIWSVNIAATAGSGNQQSVIVYYGAKQPILLGSGGASPMNVYPAGHVANPNVGNVGTRDANQLPFSPALFITDITTDPNSSAGDAQNGGAPQNPTDIYGAWKAAGGINPSTPNGTNLGDGDDTPWPPANGPAAGAHDTTWSAEVIWRLSNLKTSTGQALQAGNTYRMQLGLHDGDGTGGVAQYCFNITMP